MERAGGWSMKCFWKTALKLEKSRASSSQTLTFHILERAVRKCENESDVLDHLFGLRHDVADDNLAPDRGNLTRYIDEIASTDGFCEGTALAACLAVGDVIADQFLVGHGMRFLFGKAGRQDRVTAFPARSAWVKLHDTPVWAERSQKRGLGF